MSRRTLNLTLAAIFTVAVLASHCKKDASLGSRAAIGATPGPPGAASVKADDNPARYIVRTAKLTIKVEALDKTRAAIERLADDSGGYVHSAEYTARASARSWKVTLKMPQESLQNVLGRLRALGKVLEESLSSEEITQAVLDVKARLKNQRNTEQRLQEIALKSTGSTEDLLKVEQHLDRVRSQIEQLEAKERQYARSTSLATIHVEIVLSAPRGRPGAWARLGDAFESGFNHVKELVVLLLEAIGHAWLVVLLLFVLVILGIRVGRLLYPVLARLTGTRQSPEPSPSYASPPPTKPVQPAATEPPPETKYLGGDPPAS